MRVDARGARARSSGSCRSRRCTSRTTSPPIRALLERLPGAAAGRLLRHGLPPHAVPEVAQLFALPPRVRRGGRAPLRLPRAVVRVHRVACCRQLDAARGGGPHGRRCTSATARSMCALHGGRSVATHDGLHRGRRAADGHALRRARPGRAAVPDGRARAWTRARSSSCIYHESGLLGVSGVSSDMRDLLASDDPRGRRSRSTSSSTASRANWARSPPRSAASTRSCSPAGIGENAAAIRARVCRDAGVARRRARRRRQRRRRAARSARRAARVAA